ncbi:Cytochrome [Capsicum baccatum]|uniref:Cytochrome n=1 Tax=Capsicum baccatum TaxID=33114 RepID=A0A2G2WEH2_CAPBA|nr:Cytochrome [Capsicum baccatum]
MQQIWSFRRPAPFHLVRELSFASRQNPNSCGQGLSSGRDRDVKAIAPVATFGRVTKGEMKVGELDIPDGLILIIPVILVHYDKEIWGEDAKEFKLERFSEGVSKATKEQFSYIPFAGGPRICIGQNIAMMEAEMAIAMILQKFSFELSPSHAHAPFAIMTIHPQYGAPLAYAQL